MTARDRLTVGELCAGYGGLSKAVEEVFDATPAWFFEFDAAPSKILAHHYPDVPNHGDMTAVDWATVEPVDIISGGTPCQDLSAAGRRQGMSEGTRSNLWVQMREAIATIKPRYVVWENVRGAYSAGADSELESCAGCVGDPGDSKPVLRAFGRVLGDLADLGYDAQWRGLRAADVGAPHGRFRVFVLATRRTIADTVRGGSGGRAALPGDGEKPGPDVTADRSADRHGEPRPTGATNGEVTAVTNGGNDDGRLEDQIRGTFGRDVAAGGSGVDWGEYEPAIRRWERTLGRPAPRPTEPTGRNGGHRLSARFTEFMMGAPDGWITDPAIGLTRSEQLKACGNGVVTLQALAALQDMATR